MNLKNLMKQENKVISFGNITIDKNYFRINNLVIQISNIEKVEIGDAPKPGY